MFGGGTQNNFYGFPIFINTFFGGDNDSGMKMAHDTYRVFVNKDYVGNKVLVAQNEEIDDVSKYLRNKGFSDFTATLVGNEYNIKSIRDEAADMKSTLNVYLNTR